jgi:hypothetical protein
MKILSLLLAILLLLFGAGAASHLLRAGEPKDKDVKQVKDKDKDKEKDKDKDNKDKDKDKDREAAIQRIRAALEQLSKTREMVKECIQAEVKQKHLEEKSVKDLLSALDDVEKAIGRAEKSLKDDKR